MVDQINKDKAIALEGMIAHPGWAVLSQVLNENIEILTEALLNDIDGTIPNKEKDRMYLKRFYQKRLVDMPSKLIAALKEEAVQNDTEFDPFE